MDLLSPQNLFWLGILGAVAGLLSGLAGIGGGIVMIPAFTILFAIGNPLYVKGITFTCMIFTTVSAAFGHYRSGNIYPKVVKSIVPAALAGVAAGYLLGRAIPAFGFEILFGSFLLYVIAVNVRSIVSKGEGRCALESEISAARAGLLGLPMGLIVGVLGVGGGAVLTPCQQVFLRMGIKNSIANSTVAMIPPVLAGFALSMGGALLYGDFGHRPWWSALAVSAVMVPWLMAGAYAGARLTVVVPVRIILAVFSVLLLVTAGQMIIRGVAAALAAG